ncbi:protein SEED AND ROOT HAIR PROTECTIVE PROTEIN-like [Humulus lupulus]|uniref:protein SEED AND ROOT HAIR PROTECTIVE PROTEIN-like n=1 Tax=Humulus lupulus TaxID=3486 RepID=UPI002B40B360|nr:protein SEED AND ROOT HAIR PROTECTIVE PROTEIN-like [Humulus lupulus]
MAGSILSCMVLLSLLLIVASAINYDNGPKPNQQVHDDDDDDQHNEELLPLESEDKSESYDHVHDHHHHISDHINSVGVQGLILCNSNDEYSPLVGGLARITCIAEDENGYERAPFSMVSHKSNEKGYFMATFLVSDVLGSEDKLKLKECKAFLEGCPIEIEAACKFATDVNNGVSGALLSSYRFLPQKDMSLYTVGPFVYTSQQPDGHY